jgi:uncharacterized membrane protein
MHDNRPKIKLLPGRNELVLEMLGWALLLLLWIIAFYSLSLLPDKIPAHFDLAGNVTRYGSKHIVFMLPGLATVVLIGLSILNKYPHVFNYPIGITADNAEKQYRMATSLIRWLKLLVAGLFLILVLVMINSSQSITFSMSPWFILLIMFLFLLPIIVYFAAAKRYG